MGKTLVVVIVGILIACLLLFFAWKVIEALDNRRTRLRNERRRQSGNGRFCRWYVDDSGNWGRVITKTPHSRIAE